MAGVPSVKELHELGVARVSVGCGPMEAVLAHLRRIALALREGESFDAFTRDAIPYREVQAMFTEDRSVP